MLIYKIYCSTKLSCFFVFFCFLRANLLIKVCHFLKSEANSLRVSVVSSFTLRFQVPYLYAFCVSCEAFIILSLCSIYKTYYNEDVYILSFSVTVSTGRLRKTPIHDFSRQTLTFHVSPFSNQIIDDS